MLECLPLYTLVQVLTWEQPTNLYFDVTPLRPRADYCYSGADYTHDFSTQIRLESDSVPKTLICHDMQGGYLNDRFIGNTKYDDDYAFYNWSVVDVFVYFSHHFVTIPPVTWINAGHTNGVKVLATLITEREEGTSIWDEILENTKTTDQFASKLSEICDFYKFDGYFIDIQNEIDATKLKMLKYFLSRLKKYLGRKLVIWYDAVSLTTGELDWQSELNEHNKDAFLNVDGVFLNFSWGRENLKISAQRAGTRAIDVYVGVDVFGRFGYGGYDCDKAVAVIRSYGLSLALFATGWTKEIQGKIQQVKSVEKNKPKKVGNFEEIKPEEVEDLEEIAPEDVEDRKEIAPENVEDREEIAPEDVEDREEIAPQNVEDRQEIAPKDIEDRETNEPEGVEGLEEIAPEDQKPEDLDSFETIESKKVENFEEIDQKEVDTFVEIDPKIVYIREEMEQKTILSRDEIKLKNVENFKGIGQNTDGSPDEIEPDDDDSCDEIEPKDDDSSDEIEPKDDDRSHEIEPKNDSSDETEPKKVGNFTDNGRKPDDSFDKTGPNDVEGTGQNSSFDDTELKDVDSFDDIGRFYKDTNYVEAELKFWKKLWPFMFVHVVSETPFLTTFCRGYATNEHGVWFNLSKQQYQPSVPFSITQDRILYTPNLSFAGQGNLILRTKHKTNFRLLECNFHCGGDMGFVIAGKLQDNTKPCSVLLEIENRFENMKKSSILEFRIVKSYESSQNSYGNYDRFSAETHAKNYRVEKYEFQDGWFFYSYFFSMEGEITNISMETSATMLVGLVAVVEESNYYNLLRGSILNRDRGVPKLIEN